MCSVSDYQKDYSPYQFSFFRIIFGIYLFVYVIRVIPYSDELYSCNGILPNSESNWTYEHFLNPLLVIDNPDFVYFFVGVMGILALCIMLGFFRRISCLFFWFAWACLFGRNNLTQNPGISYIGWLLLALSLVPTGEPYSLSKTNRNWQMPKTLYWGAWLILGVSYSFSGYTKMISNSWQNGQAMFFIYTSPIAYENVFVRLILALPDFALHLQTWLALLLELLAFPLFIINRKLRFYLFILLTSMHIVVILTLDLLDVSISILLFHIFVFDQEYFMKYQQKDSM